MRFSYGLMGMTRYEDEDEDENEVLVQIRTKTPYALSLVHDIRRTPPAPYPRHSF